MTGFADTYLLDVEGCQARPGPCHELMQLQVSGGAGQRQPKAAHVLSRRQCARGRQVQLGARGGDFHNRHPGDDGQVVRQARVPHKHIRAHAL